MCTSRFTRIILPRTKSPLLGLILGISDEYRMNKIEIGKNRRRIDLNRVCILVFLCVAQFSQAQTIAQDKMQQLQYMIGEWEGTSKQIKDGVVVSEVPASESIKYGLNKHIITIDLTSENLLLHTVITHLNGLIPLVLPVINFGIDCYGDSICSCTRLGHCLFGHTQRYGRTQCCHLWYHIGSRTCKIDQRNRLGNHRQWPRNLGQI